MPASHRIAIIAVHGVGNHQPRASAHAIGELLLRVPRDGASPYTSFKEECIALPTRPVPELPVGHADTAQEKWKKKSGRTFSERPPAEVPPYKDPVDIEFMRAQLASYSSERSDGDYDTVRLEGRRLDAAGTVQADVHIYEMFWTDISKIGSSVFGVFGAFYQLVIHLPYVGAMALSHVSRDLRHEPRHTPWWWLLERVYAGSQRALTLFAPTLNMVMFALALSLVTRHVAPGARWTVAKIVLSVGVLAISILIMNRRDRARSGWRIVPLFALAALPQLLPAVPDVTAEWALIVEWWSIAAVPLWLIFTTFQRSRPFARTLAILVYLVATGLLIVRGALRATDPGAVVLNVLEYLGVALEATWFMFGSCLLLVAVLGIILPVTLVPWRKPALDSDPSAAGVAKEEALREERTRQSRNAAAAAYTARFAIAMPAIAFSTLTLLIWGAVISVESDTALSQTTQYNRVFNYPALAAHQKLDDQRITRALALASARDTAEVTRLTKERKALESGAYFLRSFWGGFDTVLGVTSAAITALAILMVIAVLMPAVFMEWGPPRLPATGVSGETEVRRSKSLGLWLSFAFRGSRIAGELLVAACVVSFVSLIVASALIFRYLPQIAAEAQRVLDNQLTLSIPSYGKLLAGAGTIGVLALIERLSKVGLGLRPVLGIAVDVDNYLRELPVDRTPRARLAERLTSLLRYVAEWRAVSEHEDSGYDAVVIVAHSQGTVIVADLLRYLKHMQGDPAEARREPRLARYSKTATRQLPIYLFTMGSPLKQLYVLRFPHLYQWIAQHEEGDYPTSHLLGVVRWVNAYRSGDYVGRAMWRTDDQSGDTYDPTKVDTMGSMMDECVGAGAHTHYWDESADLIGARVDQLVMEALSGVQNQWLSKVP